MKNKIALVKFPINLELLGITDIKEQKFGDFILEPNYKELYNSLIKQIDSIYKNKSTTLEELSFQLANKDKKQIEEILKKLL